MNYKIKFKAIYYREKTTDHYGKKGLSWHGILVYIRDNITSELKVLYFDQISTENSKQDWIAVSSLFEVLLLHLKKKMPSAKSLMCSQTMQSATKMVWFCWA